MLSPANRTATQQRQASWKYVLVGAILASHLPLLIKLAQRLWATEHYQFFPLVVAGVGYISYQRIKGAEQLVPGHQTRRLILTTGSLFLLTGALLLNSPWLGSISFMAALWAGAYILGGGELCRRVRSLWFALWLTVPLPLGLDVELIQMLQRVATQLASGLLDLARIRHVVAGVVLELPQKTFLVEEACSGIHSLFAALSCTAFYLIYTRRHFVRGFLLLTSCVFWVLMTNVGRVTVVAILGSRWDLPVTEGLPHALLGLAFFTACLGLILSTDRLLLFMVPIRVLSKIDESGKPRRSLLRLIGLKARTKRKSSAQTVPASPGAAGETHAKSERSSRNLELQPISRPEAIVVAVVFSLLFLGQFLRSGTVAQDEMRIDGLRAASAEDLPLDWNDWHRQSFESLTRDADDPNGEYTQIWYYRKGNRNAAVSIDGPFVGWHNLSGCLDGQGWSISSTEHQNYREIGEDQAGGFTELGLRKGLQRHGDVLFAVFDEQQRPIAPSETYARFRAVRRFPKISELLKRVTGSTDDGLGADDSQTYQVQVFAESATAPADNDREELRELFHEMRRLITTNHRQ